MRIILSLIRYSLLICSVLLLYPGAVTAQNSEPKVLKLSDCIDFAIKNSYQLQTDSLLSETLQMQVNQEQANYYPQISGALGFSGLFLSPYTFGQHYIQAIADWDLGKFWYKTGEIQQKQIERQKAIQQQNQLEITGVITGLYLDLQQYNNELDVLATRLEYLKKHIDILTVLWKAGSITQLDILQTQSTINGVNEAILTKQIETQQTKYTLSRLMGFANEKGLVFENITGFVLVSTPSNHTADTLLFQHPQLEAIQKEYETEQLRKREVQASVLPHIQAYTGYSYDGDPTGDGSYMLLGLGASIPIFQWGKNDYRIREIDLASDAIQSKKQDAQRELSIRYGQIINQINQYKKLLDFQQQKIATDEKAAQVAEVNYKAGVATNLDFLIAQQTLAETKMQISGIQTRYLKSVAAYYLITGQIDKLKTIK